MKVTTKNVVMRRVMSEGSICCQNCQDYCFIVLDIFLSLSVAQAKKNSHYSGHKLSKDKLKSKGYTDLCCDCRCILYDCKMRSGQEIYIP